MVTDGLIYYIDPANKNSYDGSSNIVNDLCSNYSASITAAFDSSNNGIFKFQNTNNGAINAIHKVDMNISSAPTPNYTINFYINVPSLQPAQTFGGIIGTNNTSFNVVLNNNSQYGKVDIIHYYPSTGQDGQVVFGYDNFNFNTWYYISIVGASIPRIYSNSILQSTGNITLNSNVNYSYTHIGTAILNSDLCI